MQQIGTESSKVPFLDCKGKINFSECEASIHDCLHEEKSQGNAREMNDCDAPQIFVTEEDGKRSDVLSLEGGLFWGVPGLFLESLKTSTDHHEHPKVRWSDLDQPKNKNDTERNFENQMPHKSKDLDKANPVSNSKLGVTRINKESSRTEAERVKTAHSSSSQPHKIIFDEPSERLQNLLGERQDSLPPLRLFRSYSVSAPSRKLFDASKFKPVEAEGVKVPDINPKPSEHRLKDQLFAFFQASDNKLAMKLFGSRNALLKEKRRQIAENSWIIHPCSNFRLYWDLLMLVFLISNLIVLPVSVAFFYDDVGAHWLVFNITCDALFIIDILVNFRTGLINRKSHCSVILDAKLIAMKYVKSWFAIDLLSSLPLDYVFLGLEGQSSTGRALRILRLAKLLQLLRLLRISRLVRYVKIWQEVFSIASIVMQIFNLVCVMVLIAHWSGCIQFFVPVIQGWPEDSWVSLDKVMGLDWWEQYTRSLFRAVSHMLTIGYGLWPPRNVTDTWLSIASMLAGGICYALFVGLATTLIQSFDTSSRQFRDHLQQVNEYMNYRKLPVSLRRRIVDYYEHRYSGKLFNEVDILSEISDCLRKDVIFHNCQELIHNVPFFVNADTNFVTDVITKLEFEMFQPEDIIIKVGTNGDKMYFIQEGLVEIICDTGNVVTRLSDGSYFGEISLLTNDKRVATVQAATYCNLFSFSKEHFDKILKCYPMMLRTLETIAAQRLHSLGKDPRVLTSRESLLEDVHGIRHVFEGTMQGMEESDDEQEYLKKGQRTNELANPFLTVVKSFFTKGSDNFPSVLRSTARSDQNNDNRFIASPSSEGFPQQAVSRKLVSRHDALPVRNNLISANSNQTSIASPAI